ncbi:hypothetical protein Taro_011935 [Colocasia esculenta]|uniref:Uncharacterized protein n=1 Tax=Colocasia esculenta TaxID=4460 RepID=A0A843U7L9_COLES|nr:hypothetical protein [Colocasia esculenta]
MESLRLQMETKRRTMAAAMEELRDDRATMRGRLLEAREREREAEAARADRRRLRDLKGPGVEEAPGAAAAGPAGDTREDRIRVCLPRRHCVPRGPFCSARRVAAARGVDGVEASSPRPVSGEGGGGGEQLT